MKSHQTDWAVEVNSAPHTPYRAESVTVRLHTPFFGCSLYLYSFLSEFHTQPEILSISSHPCLMFSPTHGDTSLSRLPIERSFTVGIMVKLGYQVNNYDDLVVWITYSFGPEYILILIILGAASILYLVYSLL